VPAAETGPLRRLYGVTLRDKMLNSEIHNDLNAEPLLLRIKRSMVLWIVRVIRMSQQRFAKHVLLAAHTEKWPRSRPKTSWSDYTSDLAGSRICVEPAELFQIAVDREEVRLLGLLPRNPAQRKRGYKNK